MLPIKKCCPLKSVSPQVAGEGFWIRETSPCCCCCRRSHCRLERVWWAGILVFVFVPSSLYLYLSYHPCICICICAILLVVVFVFAPSSSYLYLGHNPCMRNSTWLWCWCWRWVTHCLLYLVVFVFARDPIADWREYCALSYTLITLKKSTTWKNPSSSP